MSDQKEGDKHPMRFEVNLTKVGQWMTLLVGISTVAFWIFNYHDKFTLRSQSNLITVDINASINRNLLKYYDNKQVLTNAEQRDYDITQQQLVNFMKQRSDIIGLKK